MYQSIHYDRDKNIIHLWDDLKGYRKFPYKRYGYIKNNSGSDIALDGTTVKKVSKWTKEDEENGLMFESDLNPELRTLIDLYHESDDVSTGHRIVYFDIEVSMEGGVSKATEAQQPITAIAMRDNSNKQTICLLLDPTGTMVNSETDEYAIFAFSDEESLLKTFIEFFRHMNPTIITGWNIDEYDIPYLVNRIRIVLGEDYVSRLSPINIVNFSNMNNTYVFEGIASFDYMKLYKKFTPNEQPSYALNAISLLELGRGKIAYNGSLRDLYREDINKFIVYNIEDVSLIFDMDFKLDYISQALSLCHKGHIAYSDIWQTAKYLDGASLTYLKNIGVIAPNRPKVVKLVPNAKHMPGSARLSFTETIPKDYPKSGKIKVFKSKTSYVTIEYTDHSDNYMKLAIPLKDIVDVNYGIVLDLIGAYVKTPQIGLHEWVYDLDCTSLYPSIIRSLNISPETKVGKILDWSYDDHLNKKERTYRLQVKNKVSIINYSDLIKLIKTNNYSLSATGVLYNLSKRGFIPTILDVWFAERDEYKTLMKKHHKEGNMVLYKYFHNKQYTQKTLLNSFYGVMALQTFRFNDIQNAESVTGTGQAIIKFSEHGANDYYNNLLTTDNDYVIASDTDSLFLSVLPILQKFQVDLSDENNVVEKSLKIISKIQTFINESYNNFTQEIFNINEHYINIKQEAFAKAAIWIAKKRYGQLIINSEGVPTNKLDVKGLDIVRSDFPMLFRKFLEKILIDILNKVPKNEIDDYIINFKEQLQTGELYSIMFSSSVNDLGKHDRTDRDLFQTFKGATVQAKSTLYYNDILKYYNINDTEPIVNGDKIKWAYLKKNPLNIETLALKGYRDNQKIVDFVRMYFDYDKIFDERLLNKINDFYSALNWSIDMNSKNFDMFFKF